MYRETELKTLYERLKIQYPYDLSFSEGCLTVTRLHGKAEVTRDGAKLYVNGELYDQFSSEEVKDPDDLYELIEAFLMDLQHAGMEQGNETYCTAYEKASRFGTHFLLFTSAVLAVCVIAFLLSKNPWWGVPIFLIPAFSLIPLALIRKMIFRKYWVCPACGQPLPLTKKFLSPQMAYVPQCPHCGQVLETAPELEPIHPENDLPKQRLEPTDDLPRPGKKWPCLLVGSITAALSMFLLTVLLVSDEPLDPIGKGTAAVLLLYLVGLGLAMLLCRHTEPDALRQPIVVLRERSIVTFLGIPIWLLGLLFTISAAFLAGAPTFEVGISAVIGLPGALFALLGTWMLLAGRNRCLFVFRDHSVLYISSWGRQREFLPRQISSVRLTANRSIHLLDANGKKLASVESNMQGIPRFVEWIESIDLTATLTSAMEKQADREMHEETVVQWREEYRTRWHDHIKGIRAGLWAVMILFAAGTIAPIPLFLYAGVKFHTVMAIAALAPLPFIAFCLVFAPVLLFDDRPENATPEWNAMHVKMPLVSLMLIGLFYIGQVGYFWGGWLLQEADSGLGWLVRGMVIAAVLTVLMILRTPKRMRLKAGIYMGIVGLFLAVGLHYYVNAALCGPARHYPAVIVDSHADDPEVEDDNYELTIVLDNGMETEIAVLESIYQLAMDGEPLDVCQRESPFGVILLDIHAPK